MIKEDSFKLDESTLHKEWDSSKDQSCFDGGEETPSDAALGALLEDSEPSDDDAERRERRLGSRLAHLDALNVGGMLAAAAGGQRLASRLDAGLAAAASLASRLRRYDELSRAAPAAPHARSAAARADTNARRLLHELAETFAWLEAAAPDAPPDALASPEGRVRALAAATALQAALQAEATAPPARLRLAAVRERLRRLVRARDALAVALARHLNNALIHLGNEAAHEAAEAPTRRHHAELAPYAPFVAWLREADERAYEALAKLYTSTWARLYERDLRARAEAARASASPDRAFDDVLSVVESVCDAEQDFCTRFFALDTEGRGEAGEGEGEARRGGAARRFRGELFPALEAELVALVGHLERQDPYGAMRALACVGRRVLGGAGGGAGGAGGGAGGAGGGEGEARWARAALAGAAVAAKRGADRAVAERLAALGEGVKAAARRPKCGVFAFIAALEELQAACEPAFAASGRRADLERWYGALAAGAMQAVQHAEHPRTPRAVLHMENYHRLHAALSALRVSSLDAQRRECRARYADALRSYVTQYFGRPLDKLTQFFEGVAEAVAQGVREDEVCYRAAFSKHELRRLLGLYPAHEVRKSLHRLYRTVEKHLSEEGGLLQVVWRAMQEEFIAQHVALEARIAACYPAAGLCLPLTTQHILEAFSDIAREH